MPALRSCCGRGTAIWMVTGTARPASRCAEAYADLQALQPDGASPAPERARDLVDLGRCAVSGSDDLTREWGSHSWLGRRQFGAGSDASDSKAIFTYTKSNACKQRRPCWAIDLVTMVSQ